MGVCTDPNNVALVMEYVEGKGLDRILHDAKVPLSQTQQLRIAKDIAKGTSPPLCAPALMLEKSRG
jgi:serine/threonine protein kinase